MSYSDPPLGPEASLRSMILFTISGSKWDSNDDPHRNLCRFFAKNMALNTDDSQLACFTVAYPGINPSLMEARDLISSFCKAYGFLLALYSALIPMEAEIPVPKRQETWQSYQSMIFHLMDESNWPSLVIPTPEKNILDKLQKIMDKDVVIKHLKLNAQTLYLQAKDFYILSHNKAENIMSRIMSTCYADVKIMSHNIDLVANKIKTGEPICFPVNDLLRLLVVACKVISLSVSSHIDSHEEEYRQAVNHLLSLTDA